MAGIETSEFRTLVQLAPLSSVRLHVVFSCLTWIANCSTPRPPFLLTRFYVWSVTLRNFLLILRPNRPCLQKRRPQ